MKGVFLIMGVLPNQVISPCNFVTEVSSGIKVIFCAGIQLIESSGAPVVNLSLSLFLYGTGFKLLPFCRNCKPLSWHFETRKTMFLSVRLFSWLNGWNGCVFLIEASNLYSCPRKGWDFECRFHELHKFFHVRRSLAKIYRLSHHMLIFERLLTMMLRPR